MLPPDSVLATWEKFKDFPMETLTKIWVYQNGRNKKQRDVSLMKEHRQQYGITGNCFDLAIWLLDQFKKDGVEAYPIGHSLKTESAHVAIVAVCEHGHRYLCDLGDQWLTPILIDSDCEDYDHEPLCGFFPAAKVQVNDYEHNTEILYFRENGKTSRQIYHTEPIEMNDFLQAAEYSQNLIKPRPLLECRIPYKNEIAHWEFYNWESFLSTNEGLFKEPKIKELEEMVEKIHQHTRYHKEWLFHVLEAYRTL